MLIQWHWTVMKEKISLIDSFVQETIEIPYLNQIIPTNTKKLFWFFPCAMISDFFQDHSTPHNEIFWIHWGHAFQSYDNYSNFGQFWSLN